MNQKNKLISIIVPLYNKETIILETLHSVLNQDFIDYELIIVDDGSTDRSIELIKSINDNRINIFEKENGGVSSARNYGAELAKGKYLFFLDADDQITSDCLSKLVELTKDYPNANIYSGNFINHTLSGRNIPYCLMQKRGYVSNPIKKFFYRDFMPRTGASLFPKDIYFEIGGFDDRISIFEDLDFDMKLLKYCKYAYTPEVIYIHRDEYAELSIKPKPIEKYFSFYIEIDSQNFWEKMELIYCLRATYYKFKGFGDKKNSSYLKNKLQKHFILSFINRIMLKYVKYRRLIIQSNFMNYRS